MELFAENQELLAAEIDLEKTARKAKARQRVLLRKQKKGTLTKEEEAELKGNASLIIQNSARQKAAKAAVEARRQK